MKVTKDTKVAEVLKEYPWLKEELIKMDDRAKMLDSPMAKIVLKKATVQDACGKLGMSVDELLAKFEEMVKAHG